MSRQKKAFPSRTEISAKVFQISALRRSSQPTSLRTTLLVSLVVLSGLFFSACSTPPEGPQVEDIDFDQQILKTTNESTGSAQYRNSEIETMVEKQNELPKLPGNQ